MCEKIQIVAFDVPYPANYGGVIDVFYKLKALHHLGVEIVLHTFEYGRGEQEVLGKYCAKVYYYPRKNFGSSFFSTKPFIVKTRAHKQLLLRLNKLGGVVLFEGLHTTLPLIELDSARFTFVVRTHNIEHNYYKGLCKSERNLFLKLFFLIESWKLKNYERVLNKTHHILSISPSEQDYFSNKYEVQTTYIPVFTEMKLPELIEEENFILWHGDLRVSDNVKSALMAIAAVKNTSYQLVIASSRENPRIQKAILECANIKIDTLSNPERLEFLLSKAKINVLFTFQATGIKLKLLNALVRSRFVIVNSLMVDQTGLEQTCVVANSIEEIRNEIGRFMSLEFTNEMRVVRKNALKDFNTIQNAQKIIDLLC